MICDGRCQLDLASTRSAAHLPLGRTILQSSTPQPVKADQRHLLDSVSRQVLGDGDLGATVSPGSPFGFGYSDVTECDPQHRTVDHHLVNQPLIADALFLPHDAITFMNIE